MSEQVAKSKNEGRVAAGKRLVESNRKNKENFKNREQVTSSGDSSVPSRDAGDQQEPQSQTSTVFYGGGALAVLAVIGVALYLYHEKKPAPPKALSNNDDDIFCLR